MGPGYDRSRTDSRSAFFFYPGHPDTDSNLYSTQVPGWISFVIFILIGTLAYIARLRDRARDAKKGKSDVSPKT